ncbi:MAG: N-6 DNA methylase [gamma proteobacterium symbiont of Clathrolucina costata]
MTNQEFKDKLWEAANALRGSVTAAQYKYPVLGLIFLKYVSDMFEAQADVIKRRLSDPKSDFFIDDDDLRQESEEVFINDKTFYESDNVFWVPEGVRFQELLGKAADADFPQQLDQAMATLEAENPPLKGILYRDFGRLELEEGKLGDLIAILAKIKFDPKSHGSRDIFGEVYEYFLGKFARQEGARAGEFYTPKSVVALLVEILAPFRGTIYDPACGSGGMFVQSAKFKDAHATRIGKKGDLPIYGQELMAATRKLCKMNLAVHGLEGDLGKSYGSTFTNDQHHTLRADYILANPPFNISDWGGDKLQDDPRWAFGIPPTNNANFAWLQHMLSRLSARGRAGIVLSNGSITSQQSGEGDIRKEMVKADVVECMVSLPGQLFSNTPIPVCLWFLSKDKKRGVNGDIEREKQILFIDARKVDTEKVSSTQNGFSDEAIHFISRIYHRWRGTSFSDGGEYEDVTGLCYSASFDEISEHAFVLAPNRYVGTEEVAADDDENFENKMESLVGELSELLSKNKSLEESLRMHLGSIGYEI